MGYIDIACRVALGTVFAVAAVSKLRDRAAFAGFAASLGAMKLPPVLRTRTVAVAVVFGEVAVPILVAIPGTVAAGYILAALLLTAFAAGIAPAVVDGSHVPCRCFGSDGAPLSIRHLVRNGLLLALGVAGLLVDLGASAEVGDVGGAVVAVATGGLLGSALTRWDDLAFLVAGPAPSGGVPVTDHS
jgi:hypothetical protein